MFAFVEIALHRRGPDELPASRFVLGMVLVAYLAVAFATLRLGAGVEHPILLLAVDTVFSLAFIWSVLKAFDHERRFKQTASALLGTDTFLNFMSMPLILWGKALESSGGDNAGVAIRVHAAVDLVDRYFRFRAVASARSHVFPGRGHHARLRPALDQPPPHAVSDASLMRIHILGICGTFMGGIAAIAKAAGHTSRAPIGTSIRR